MINKQYLFLLLIVLTSVCSVNAFAQNNQIIALNHPRLLMLKSDEAKIKIAIETSKQWAMIHQLLLGEADVLLSQPVSERIVIGRRLLDVSRETLRRILILGYTYRLTGEEKYANRAKEELSAVTGFQDWNPSHFLDVAEMTTAVAIGYDWLYDKLSGEEKEKIRYAILQKGLNPSLDTRYNDWLDRINNWNQVCNTGMAYGALAIYEDIPDLAHTILTRSVESIRKPMGSYAPDGAYPEGYSYWGYGTTYNVMMIDALEKNTGSDSDLSQMPGFLQTPEFILHMIAPDRKSFNYGDNSDSGRLSPAMFWFANKTKNHSLLWNEAWLLEKGNKKKLIDYRFLTLAIIWGAGIDIEHLAEPKEKMWVSANSTTPVAFIRTSWDKTKGVYLAFKGGTAKSSHTHLDVGSFIMVENGIRWAMDFGRQDYNSLESKGIDLWNREQDSDRWKIFTYNNLAHNTLTFNNQFQQVDGYAQIKEYASGTGFSYAISDMSEIYNGQATKTVRGVAIVNERYVVVRDELKTGSEATTLRWTMLTPAQVLITDKNTAELSLKGKKLRMEVVHPAEIKLKTWDTTPATELDSNNEGTTLIGFEIDIPANTNTCLQVKLIPQDAGNAEEKIPALNKWNEYKNK